jgi:hypothetical protein
MRHSRLSLTRRPYETDSDAFELEASNGLFAGTLEFYAAIDDIDSFAMRLIAFPGNARHEVCFELGAPGGNWACHLLLRAFLRDTAGHAALEVKMSSSGNASVNASASFPIVCEVAAINRLGSQLHEWCRGSEDAFLWETRDV